MKTNSDARIWCSENYNTAQETFYIYNAKKIIFEEWRTSWMHALFSIGLVSAGFTFGFIPNPLLLLASMQVGFALYGILSYCHNDQGAGGLAYISTLIFLPNALKDAPSSARTAFIFAGMVLLIASAITERNYRKVLGSYTQTTQRQWANDEEEFEAWKRKYYTGYSRPAGAASNTNYTRHENNYQSAYAEPARPINPYTEKAQALFADFGNTYVELKKRYRKLAHQYHPDRGGDHETFVAIVNEYEYLKSTRFPGKV